jgi:hypothetical protein
MSTFEKHYQESIKLFDQPNEEVYLWFDEFQGTPKYKIRHRRVRHHEAGIKQAGELFGEVGGKIARQHIIPDLKGVGWTGSGSKNSKN